MIIIFYGVMALENGFTANAGITNTGGLAQFTPMPDQRRQANAARYLFQQEE